MHICIHTSIYVYTYVYVHTYICTHICIHTYIWIHTHIYVYTQTYICTHTYICIHTFVYTHTYIYYIFECMYVCFVAFPGGSVKNPAFCGAGDLGSIPGLREIPWRREWQPTPVFLPGGFHGQRSLAGYSAWGLNKSDTTEPLTLSFTFIFVFIQHLPNLNNKLTAQCMMIKPATRTCPPYRKDQNPFSLPFPCLSLQLYHKNVSLNKILLSSSRYRTLLHKRTHHITSSAMCPFPLIHSHSVSLQSARLSAVRLLNCRNVTTYSLNTDERVSSPPAFCCYR